MKTRCSRVVPILIRGLWAMVSFVRALWDGARRVRVLPIGVQRWDNGITFGVLIIVYHSHRSSPANGKESDHAHS